ncbi:ABC transporter permease [Desulfosoma caldarium]|uniref:Phospholipid/cholesterol/gamma-HCH transport system permease protein n=1 Tax=Desulfosoma caldarium TaxID=610254 RepID=A0A3N1UVS0_9BACT|nr:MlaE family lipid ABC transporter permease subunit [Desulfosoma caldarium]ROQ93509.1 phospholipid/cholesterol/gamma-HCH transport system permease protein [Desulfosoma caldarium]
MKVPHASIDVREPGHATWAPTGPLTLKTVADHWKTLQNLWIHPSLRHVVVDVSGLDAVDSAGLVLLKSVRDRCAQRAIAFELKGVPERFQAFFTFGGLQRTQGTKVSAPRPARGFVTRLGEASLEAWQDLRDMVLFVGNVTVAFFPCCLHPKRFRIKEVLYYVQRAGSEAMPIVFLVSFLMGLIMAFQAAVQLRQFGANIFVADLVSLALTRELGPLMTAIILAGRSAAAFAAEIGTMKVNEEVDALTVMGFNVTEYLIMPKVNALAISGPLLTVFANTSGILGGLVVGTLGLDLTPASFIVEVGQILTVTDVLSGLAKSFVFAVLVALVGCLRGLQTEKSADSVGRMTTSAVVTSIFMIILADAAFTVLYHVFDI